MDGDYISRHEHEEFRRSMEAENQRLEDENKRQNHRLEALEEQVNQGKRLETLESQDGEKWRKAVWCVISAIIGIAVGMIFRLPVS